MPVLSKHLTDSEPALQKAAAFQGIANVMQQDLLATDLILQQLMSYLGSKEDLGPHGQACVEMLGMFNRRVQKAKTEMEMHAVEVRGLAALAAAAFCLGAEIGHDADADVNDKYAAFEIIRNSLQGTQTKLKKYILCLESAIKEKLGETPLGTAKIIEEMDGALVNIPGSEFIRDILKRLTSAETKLSQAESDEFNKAMDLSGTKCDYNDCIVEVALLSEETDRHESWAQRLQSDYNEGMLEARRKDKQAADTVNDVSCKYNIGGVTILSFGKESNDAAVAEDRAQKFRMKLALFKKDSEAVQQSANERREQAQAKKKKKEQAAAKMVREESSLTELKKQVVTCRAERDALLAEQKALQESFSGASCALIAQFADVAKKVSAMYGDFSKEKGGQLGEYKNFLSVLDEKITMVISTKFWIEGVGLQKIVRAVRPLMSSLVDPTVCVIKVYCKTAETILSPIDDSADDIVPSSSSARIQAD